MTATLDTTMREDLCAALKEMMDSPYMEALLDSINEEMGKRLGEVLERLEQESSRHDELVAKVRRKRWR